MFWRDLRLQWHTSGSKDLGANFERQPASHFGLIVWMDATGDVTYVVRYAESTWCARCGLDSSHCASLRDAYGGILVADAARNRRVLGRYWARRLPVWSELHYEKWHGCAVEGATPLGNQTLQLALVGGGHVVAVAFSLEVTTVTQVTQWLRVGHSGDYAVVTILNQGRGRVASLRQRRGIRRWCCDKENFKKVTWYLGPRPGGWGALVRATRESWARPSSLDSNSRWARG